MQKRLVRGQRRLHQPVSPSGRRSARTVTPARHALRRQRRLQLLRVGGARGDLAPTAEPRPRPCTPATAAKTRVSSRSATSRYVHELIDIGVDFDRAVVAGAAHRRCRSTTADVGGARKRRAARRYRLNGSVDADDAISAAPGTRRCASAATPSSCRDSSSRCSPTRRRRCRSAACWRSGSSGRRNVGAGRGQFGFDDTGDVHHATAATRG